MRTASLMDVLCWLTQPQGPHLVDDTSAQDSFMALAILVTPEALYDMDFSRVRLGLVYKPPYIQAASFSEAYFSLKSVSQAEAGNWPTTALVTFMRIHESSQVIPLPGVPTLFLDMKTEEDINSNDPWPPQDFWGFRLHKVLYLGGGMTTGLVAIPTSKGQPFFTGPQCRNRCCHLSSRKWPSSLLPSHQRTVTIGTLGMMSSSRTV